MPGPAHDDEVSGCSGCRPPGCRGRDIKTAIRAAQVGIDDPAGAEDAQHARYADLAGIRFNRDLGELRTQGMQAYLLSGFSGMPAAALAPAA